MNGVNAAIADAADAIEAAAASDGTDGNTPGGGGGGGGGGGWQTDMACKKLQRFWRRLRWGRTTRALAVKVMKHGPTITQVEGLT